MTIRGWIGLALFVGFLVALSVTYVQERGCYDPTTIDYEYDPVPCR